MIDNRFAPRAACLIYPAVNEVFDVMRLIHIADTHLGLAAFPVLNPETGANLREELMYENFLSSIEKILACRPDALVHAGDLFHHVKPKTRAYTTVLAALDRLAESGIPFIGIAGNHSMIKARYTVSPFEVLEFHAADVHIAYRFRYERVECAGACFHLIPNMLRPEDYRHAFDEITLSASMPNVLVTHGLATILADRRLQTVAEHEIDATMLSDDFSYIALGHFHGQVPVTQNAWYAGSPEYCNYGEIGDVKGGLSVDPEKGMITHLDLPHTPMLDLGKIDCAGLSGKDIAERILALAGDVRDMHAMCLVTLIGARQDQTRSLDRKAIHAGSGHLLDLKVRIFSGEEDSAVFERVGLDGADYLQEFASFIAGWDISEGMRERVRQTGRAVLRDVICRHEEKDHAP
ncbi:MAG: metallophosphoesterase [Methanomicrobiales archaeon]|nr:metallophosphoesterase [Methanomicrobiales archaeon]